MSRAEQRTPTSPPAGLRWPGRGDEPSGSALPADDDAGETKRAEQSRSQTLSDGYLLIDGGGWTPEQSGDGALRNYEELRERHPGLPVRRPNEARRFA